MTELPRSLKLHLGTTAAAERVTLRLGAGSVGLLVAGDRPPVLAIARTMLIQLAEQTRAPVLLRADDRITVGDEPVVRLLTDVARLPPPGDGVPRLTVDGLPWAKLETDLSIRLRCRLTSQADFPALLEAAGMRCAPARGRHRRADENGGFIATSALIS
jgi:hypothetical protein